MKRAAIFAGVLILALAFTYAQASASTVTFSYAKARAGHDRDRDPFLAEAEDGPWKALARASSLNLGGLSSYTQAPEKPVTGGRASSTSLFYQPFVVTGSGTQRIEFNYSGLLEISSDNAFAGGPHAKVGYSLFAIDDQHNKYWESESLRDIDSVRINENFTFKYSLEVGDEIRLFFLLNTFAKFRSNRNGFGVGEFEDLNLLADFSNSFEIIGLEGLKAIPIPGTALLLGSALSGLVGLRRWKR